MQMKGQSIKKVSFDVSQNRKVILLNDSVQTPHFQTATTQKYITNELVLFLWFAQ